MPAEGWQHVAGEVLGLVGDDAPARAGGFQRGQHRFHAFERMAVAAQFLLVDHQEFRHQRVARGDVQIRECRAHHRPRSLGHVGAQVGQGHRRASARDEHAIGGGDEVRRAVQQRAVEIEQGHRRETGTRRRVIVIHQAHAAFTAQAR